MFSQNLRRALVAMGLSLLVLMPELSATSFAQDQPSEPVQSTVEGSAEQRELNNEAIRALGDEEYLRAISLLEESLYLGELNLTYLNLGRANQLAGRCRQAREALEKVSQAPALAKPPAGFVRQKAEQYLDELPKDCASEQEPPEQATAEADPGGIAMTDGGDPEPTQPPEPSSGRDTLGYALTGAGVVAAGTALGLHLAAVGIRQDALAAVSISEPVSPSRITQAEFRREETRYENFETAALTSAIAGGALVGTGLYFLFTDAQNDSAAALRLHTGVRRVEMSFLIEF